jgi:perosamine synthetase
VINLAHPIIGPREIAAVEAVLASGNLASGARVKELEESFARFCGVEQAVAVGSGTAALYLGLLAGGVGPGDEVIVPSFTFAATANAVKMCGATPIFIDIDPDTYCITGTGVAGALSERTKGVMPVHLYGHPAPMDEIVAVAVSHGIDVYEDAAQAHGGEWNGRSVGSWGRFGAFSFYPTKNMTTGEGGMVTTDDADIADRVRLLRNQGMRRRYEHEIVGLNERMTEIEAAIGLVQLENLPGWTTTRIANAAYFRAHLDPVLGIPSAPTNGTHVYHQFTLRPDDRDRITGAMDTAGVGYGIYYPIPTHLQPQFRDVAADLPETDAAAAHVISIPIRPDLRESELAFIVSTLNEAVA